MECAWMSRDRVNAECGTQTDGTIKITIKTLQFRFIGLLQTTMLPLRLAEIKCRTAQLETNHGLLLWYKYAWIPQGTNIQDYCASDSRLQFTRIFLVYVEFKKGKHEDFIPKRVAYWTHRRRINQRTERHTKDASPSWGRRLKWMQVDDIGKDAQKAAAKQ